MKVVSIIPARYQSKRFPGKPLVEIAGKPMIEHVYRRVERVELIDEVIVATDDDRIYDTVADFGGKAWMTSAEHSSGTDRIAEVAREISCDIVVNVQGDEPVIKSEMIKSALNPLLNNVNIEMSTLKCEINDDIEMNDPNIVKVITDLNNNAIYFSRSLVPYLRGKEIKVYKHIGLYVYTRDFLLQFSSMESTPLEEAESLEQLRVLENGYNIRVVETKYNSIGVDIPEDVDRVERVLQSID